MRKKHKVMTKQEQQKKESILKKKDKAESQEK
jgi:hypothetical protein